MKEHPHADSRITITTQANPKQPKVTQLAIAWHGPSALIPDTWIAGGLYPTQHRLGDYPTEQ